MCRFLPVLAVVLLVPACKDTLEPPSCESRAAELGRWLNEVDGEGGSTVMLGSGLHLVEADAPRIARPAPVVQVNPDSITINGEPAFTQVEVTEGLQARLQMDAYLGREDPELVPTVLLAIDRDAPFTKVAEMVTAATAAGYTRAGFLVGKKSRLQPPPPSSVSEDLARIERLPDPSERVMRLAELMKKVYEKCPPVTKVLGRLAVASPDARSMALARQIPDAIAECKCACDLDAVRSLHWVLQGPQAGIVTGAVYVSLARPADTEVQVATGKPDARWADAHQAVLAAVKSAAGKPLRVELDLGAPQGGAAVDAQP